MFPATYIHLSKVIFQITLLILSKLRPTKSQLDSRSYFFVIFYYLIYVFNDSNFILYFIELNHIVLKNLLSTTLQQVFLFVNTIKNQNTLVIPISLIPFFYKGNFPYFYVSLYRNIPILSSYTL